MFVSLSLGAIGPAAASAAPSECADRETAPVALSKGAKLVGRAAVSQVVIDSTPVAVVGGTATIFLSGATFVASPRSEFYVGCYTPADPARGIIPMVALGGGRFTVRAPASATGEFGVITRRIAAIAKPGAAWSIAWDGTNATLQVTKGPPVQGHVPRIGAGESIVDVAPGHSIVVGPGQAVTSN